MEIERKLILSGARDANAVGDLLQGVMVLSQQNRFFDDESRHWQRRGVALRLREVDHCAWFAAKGKAVVRDGFLHRPEFERELTRADRAVLIAGGSEATELVRRLLEPAGLSEPTGGPLFEVAGFENERRLGVWVASSGNSWEVALDRASYPDGSVDYEIELEIHGQDPSEALAALSELVRAADVTAAVSRVSKRARLARAMGEVPRDD